MINYDECKLSGMPESDASKLRFFLKLKLKGAKDGGLVVFMKNPSSADQFYSDATTNILIEKLHEIYSEILIVNMFPLVASDKEILKKILVSKKESGHYESILEENFNRIIENVEKFSHEINDLDFLLATGDLADFNFLKIKNDYDDITNKIKDIIKKEPLKLKDVNGYGAHPNPRSRKLQKELDWEIFNR